jgi:hypothetical protein
MDNRDMVDFYSQALYDKDEIISALSSQISILKQEKKPNYATLKEE